MKKRLMSWLLVMTMLLSCLPVTAFAAGEQEGTAQTEQLVPASQEQPVQEEPVALAAEDRTVTASGYCGNGGDITSLTWTLYDDGEMVISGVGRMLGYSRVPWEDSKTEIKTVRIEGSVTYIGYNAFSNCGNLTEIIVSEDSSDYCAVDGVLFNKRKTKLVQYPGGREGAYTIPATVTEIDSEAFAGCAGLTSVTIPDSVTDIGSSAFRDCSSLTSVTIGAGVSQIGNYAFLNCLNLSYVNYTGDVAGWCGIDFGWAWPNTPLAYGGALYINGKRLTKLTIPDGVTEIKEYVFENCTSLTSVIIPDSVTTIGAYAFSGSGVREMRFYGDAPSVGTDFASSNNSLLTIYCWPSKAGWPSTGTWQGHRVCSLPYIEVSAAKNGTVEVDKTEVLEGETVTVTATPDDGYRLEAIYVDFVAIEGNTFTVTGSHTVTARFVVDDDASAAVYTPNDGDVFYIQQQAKAGKLAWALVIDSVCDPDRVGEWVYITMPPLCDSKTSSVQTTSRFWTIQDGLAYRFLGIYNNTESVGGHTVGGYKFSYHDKITAIDTSAATITRQNVHNSDGGSPCSKSEWKHTDACGSTPAKQGAEVALTMMFNENTRIINLTDKPVSGTTVAKQLASISTLTNGGNALVNFYAANGAKGATDVIADVVLVLPVNPADVVIPAAPALYTVSVGAVENGTVRIDNTTALSGQTVTVTTIPNDGYKLEAIYVDGVAIEGNTFTISGNHVVTATFKPEREILASGYCGGEGDGTNLTWTLYADGEMVIKGTGAMMETSFWPWENHRGLIEKITVEDGVTTIGSEAFRDCVNAKSVTMPDSITVIKATAFARCGMDSIRIPTDLSTIEPFVFLECKNLTAVTIPDAVTSIGNGSFQRCGNLKSVTLPDGLTAIGRNAFDNCDSLISVEIPDRVTTIDYQAFASCDALTAITVAEGNSVYCDVDGVLFSKGMWTLIQVPGGMTGEYIIPNGVAEIDSSAFYNCNKLNSVILPDSISTIFGNAFDSCGGLNRIVIPGGVTSIYTGAFSNCENLSEVEFISDALAEKDGRLFFADTYERSIYYHEGCNGWLESEYYDAFAGTWCGYPLVMIEAEEPAREILASGYCGGEGDGTNLTWTLYADGEMVIEGTGSMKNYEFAGGYTTAPWAASSAKIKKVTIKDGVTTIGGHVFHALPALTDVSIPDGVTTIGASAFHECEELAEIVIPDSVTTLGGSAFKSCISLKSVTIGNSVTSIGESAFAGCYNITRNLVMPASVTQIGSLAFYYCKGLTRMEFLGDAPAEVSENAFYDCTSLTIYAHEGTDGWPDTDTWFGRPLVMIPTPREILASGVCGADLTWTIYADGEMVIEGTGSMYSYGTVTSVPWGEHRLAVEKITIGNGVTSAPQLLFQSCYRVGSVVFGDSVDVPDAYTLCHATMLEHIEVDGNNPYVKAVDDVLYSKDGKTLICHPKSNPRTSFVVPDGVEKIGVAAFGDSGGSGNYFLTSITLPDSVTVIDSWAFANCGHIETLNLGNGLRRMGSGAGFCTPKLKSVVFPASFEGWPGKVFWGYSGLTSAEFLGNAPTNVAEVLGTDSQGKIVATIYYHEGTTGWTEGEHYDAEAGTWCGHPLVMIPAEEQPEPIAKIGEVGYESLDAALAAAQDGDTVVLLDNYGIRANTRVDYDIIYFDTGKNVTLDLGGKRLLHGVISNEIAGLNVQSGTLTLTNGELYISSAYCDGVWVTGGKLIVLPDAVVTGGDRGICVSGSGQVEVQGTAKVIGTIYGNEAAIYAEGSECSILVTDGAVISGTTYAMNTPDASAVTISGGDFTGEMKLADGATITGGTFDVDVSAYVAEGYECTESGERYVVFKAVSESVHAPVDGDVFYIQQQAKAGEKAWSLVIAAATDEYEVGEWVYIMMPDFPDSRKAAGQTTSRFWTIQDGLAYRFLGTYNSSASVGGHGVGSYKFSYHDKINAVDGTVMTITRRNVHFDGYNNHCSYSAWKHSDSCGSASAMQGAEAPLTMLFDVTTKIINLTDAAISGSAVAEQLASIKALTDTGNYLVNLYVADGAKDSTTSTVDLVLVLPADPADVVIPTPPVLIYTVSVGSVENGTVTLDKVKAAEGETVTVTATPNAGYKLEAIYVDGVAIEGNEFTITGNHTVTATFRPDREILDSGYCGGEGDGTNLTWTLYADGEMVISGSGAMADYGYEGTKFDENAEPPWADIRDKILTVTLGSDVTNVGNAAFFHCVYLRTVTIGSGVTAIGNGAFGWCEKLAEVVIPDGVISIGSYAFNQCYELIRTEFLGNAPAAVGEYVFDYSDKVTIYYHEGTIGWTESEHYDAEAGTWCGHPLVMIPNPNKTYTITVGEVANGTVTVSPEAGKAGETVTVTATPNAGYKLEAIYVDGVAIEGNVFTITGNHTVTAVFEAAAVEVLYLSQTAVDNGAVTANGWEYTAYTTSGTSIIITVKGKAEAGFYGYVVNEDGSYTLLAVPDADAVKQNQTLEVLYGTKLITTHIDYYDAAGAVIVDARSEKAVEESDLGTITTLNDLKSAMAQEATIVLDALVDNDTKTITVIFVTGAALPEEFSVSVRKAANGTVNVVPSSGPAGTTVTVIATPDKGYELESIVVDDKAINGNTFAITGSHVVTAVFRAIPYSVSVAQVSNGTLSVSKTTATVGERITITAIPAQGYALKEILVNGSAIAGTFFTMPAGNVTVSAVFDDAVYTVGVVQTENGTVSIDKTTGKVGETVVVTAKPDAGYELLRILVDGTPRSKTNPYSFKISGNHTVSAIFEEITYSVSVGRVSNGTVRVSPSYGIAGTVVTVTATPNVGYALKQIKVDGEAISGNTFTVTGNHTVTADFEALSYNVSVEPAANGEINVDKSVAKTNEVVTVTAVPAENFALKEILVNGTAIKGNTFVMPANDVVVTAVFDDAVYAVDVVQSDNGSVGVNKTSGKVGEVITVTAAPASGYELVRILVNGIPASMVSPYSFKISGNHTVSAVFEEIKVQTTNVSGSVTYTDGTVVSNTMVELLRGGAVEQRVSTNHAGEYTFTQVGLGDYSIRVTDETGNTDVNHISVLRMSSKQLFVSGDTHLMLRQSWTVSGTVSEAAVISLLNERGNVVISMTVSAGAFAMAGVANGTYIIRATSDNGSDAKEITVFNGSISGISLVIPELSVTINGAVLVEDRGGSTYAAVGATVTVKNTSGVVVGRADTDADGRYSFANLPLGDYVLGAQIREQRSDTVYSYLRYYTLSGSDYVVADVAGVMEAPDLILREGTETRTTVSGRINAKGSNQAGVTILQDMFGNEVRRDDLDPDGKYEFPSVPDGQYTIIAITEKAGVGFVEISITDGVVKGDTHIFVEKAEEIEDMEASFFDRVPYCEDSSDAMKYRSAIAAEKAWYDSLAQNKKSQLSAEYVERLEKLCAWIVQMEYTTPEGASVDMGGLVVSEEELEQGNTVQFELIVENKEKHEVGSDGVQSEADHIQIAIEDAAGEREVVQYYDISMLKSVDGGQAQEITDVAKDTNATGKFRITLTIPEECRGYKHYSIIHVHNGEPLALEDLDNDPDTITIEVDRFSTFALTATNMELDVEDGAETFAVTVGETINGTVAVDKAEAEVGEIVTITAAPAEGYVLHEIYVDGVAIPSDTFTVTGDHTVSAEFVEIAEFFGSNVDMGNKLAMNFVVHQTYFKGLTGLYAEITGPVAESKEPGVTQTMIVEQKDWVTNGAYYMFTYGAIAAKQMGEKITVTIYNARGNAISEVYEDSMSGYIERKLEDQGKEGKALFVDMLNYGAAAQTKFGYDAENLANSWLSDAQKAYGSSEMKNCTNNIVKGANYKGTSLVLTSRISMQIAFENVKNLNLYAKVSFTDHMGEKVDVRIENADIMVNGNYRVVKVEQIVVADGRMPITCEVYNADTNELVASCVDSMESYIARMATGDDEWMKTIMIFSDSAHAYIHRNDPK